MAEIELLSLCEELNLPEEDREFVGFIENFSNTDPENLDLPDLEDLREELSLSKRRVVDAIAPFNRRGVMPQRREIKRNLITNVPYLDFTELAENGYIRNPKISLLVRLYAELRKIGNKVGIRFPELLKKTLQFDSKGYIAGPGGTRYPVYKYFYLPDSSKVPRVYFVNALDLDGVPFPKKVLPLPQRVPPNPEKITFYQAYRTINRPNRDSIFFHLIQYKIV